MGCVKSSPAAVRDNVQPKGNQTEYNNCERSGAAATTCAAAAAAPQVNGGSPPSREAHSASLSSQSDEYGDYSGDSTGGSSYSVVVTSDGEPKVSDYQLTVRLCKHLEHILRTDYKCRGTGLGQYAQSARGERGDRLPKRTKEIILRVARQRNKLVHEQDCHSLDNREQFLRDYGVARALLSAAGCCRTSPCRKCTEARAFATSFGVS